MNTKKFKEKVASATPGDVKDSVEKVANDIGQETRHLIEQGRNQIGSAIDTYEETVKNNPIKSSIAAFALGAIVGKILTK